MNKSKHIISNNFLNYTLNNNKIILVFVFFSIVALILISILIKAPNSILSLSQALLISFIASFILYLLVETFPSYKKNKNVKTFCNNIYSQINESMSSIIESLKLSADISNTETNFEKLNHVNYNGRIYYVKRASNTNIWMYYDFCIDFKKEVDSIKRLVDKIIPLTPHLNHEEALLLTKIYSSPLYKCIEMKIYMSQIGFSAHDNGIADNFQNFLLLHSQMLSFIPDYKEYSYEIMSQEMIDNYKTKLDDLVKDKKELLEKTKDNTNIIMNYVKSGKSWLRV